MRPEKNVNKTQQGSKNLPKKQKEFSQREINSRLETVALGLTVKP